MVKTSSEFEKEFLSTIHEKTGKDLQQWLTLVKSSGIEKRNDILEWLKKGHGLNHMQSQLLTGMYLNNGKPVYLDGASLLEDQFIKCPEMRTLFEEIAEIIISTFQGTQLIPKKTYLSFTAVREFAAINVKPKEIRLGLDLGDIPFTETIQKAKLIGPMPRISHMVVLTRSKHFDINTPTYLKQSYNRTHIK